MPPQPENNQVAKNRREDLAWREENRKEDILFREATREMDHDRRRKESRLATRRSALDAAAQSCARGTPATKVLEVAVEFEAWIRRPSQAK